MVVSVNECDGGLPAFHHGFWNLAVGHDDDQIAEVHEVRSGAVELDDTGASRTGDRVGGQAIAIVHIRNVDSLPGRNVRRVQQVLIDGDRTDVVQVSTRDGGAVDLALNHRAHDFTHRHSPVRWAPQTAYCRSGAWCQS